MTKEEAIARIKNHKIKHKMNEPRAIYISEALDMGIEALEHDPCDDVAAFKEDVLDAIARVGIFKSDTKAVQAVAECLKAVEALSPVMPLQKEHKRNIEEDKAERYKDCFQPNSNEKLHSSQKDHVEEDAKAFREVLTAFQLGLSFGFIDGLNANKTQESKEEKHDLDTGTPDNTGNNDSDNTSLEVES